MNDIAEKYLEDMDIMLRQIISYQNMEYNMKKDFSKEIENLITIFFELKNKYYNHLKTLPKKIMHHYNFYKYDYWLRTVDENGNKQSIMFKDLTPEIIRNRKWE